MLRLLRACAVTVTLALAVPGTARAMPITFEFTGYIDKTGGFPGLAEGGPLTATLSYDTDVWTKVDDDGDSILYSGGSLSFDMHAGAYVWSAGPYMRVWKAGDQLAIGLAIVGTASVRLEGVGLLSPGGAAPTSINLASVTSDQILGRDFEHTLSAHFTSVVRTQRPDTDPIPAPEPATLTLSAVGLAALLARRRARAARVWHAGGEVFHAATKAGP